MGRTRLAAAVVAASVAGLTGVAGGLAFLAVPAAAAGSQPPSPTPTVSIRDPAQGSPPQQIATPTITGNITPTDTANGEITRVDIQLTCSNCNNQQPPAISVTPSSTTSGQGQRQWTFSVQVPPLAYNGPYRVVATATERDPSRAEYQGPESARRDLGSVAH